MKPTSRPPIQPRRIGFQPLWDTVAEAWGKIKAQRPETINYGPSMPVWTNAPAVLWAFDGASKLPESPEGVPGLRTVAHHRFQGEWIYVWLDGAWVLGRAETAEAEAARLHTEVVLLRVNVGKMGLTSDLWELIPGWPVRSATMPDLAELARTFERGWNKLALALLMQYFHHERYYGLVLSGELGDLTEAFHDREACLRELMAAHDRGKCLTYLLHVTPKGEINLSLVRVIDDEDTLDDGNEE
jgi:hypothetical protein